MRVKKLKMKPGLAVILIGDDPASHVYVELKEKACEEVGIYFEKYLYKSEADESIIIRKIQELNKRKDIHGILVQLPLPCQDEDRIISEIDIKKDVDGFHPDNLKLMSEGKPGMVSAVALGVLKLIDNIDIKKEGLTALIIASDIFASPIAHLLNEIGVKIIIMSPDSEELIETLASADIVISAIGKPGFIKGDYIKNNSIVIDVGTTRVNGKILGDIEQNSTEKKAAWLTPVPGGVGPMTVAMLLVNVLKAYQFQKLSP
jgi:methylenetetrahydrofolate dehydrogenase (NADP+)/methenyltetrahydrofolate cyclohydrolase